MLCRTLATVLVGTLVLATSCDNPAPVSPPTDRPMFAGVPADGQGNKQVTQIDVESPITCAGGATLVAHFEGWLQTRTFGQPANRNILLDVIHVTTTFTNSAGETFAFTDVGNDRVYTDTNGDLVVALTGRISGSPAGFGAIGRLVVNLETGEVEFIAGQQLGDVGCEALT